MYTVNPLFSYLIKIKKLNLYQIFIFHIIFFPYYPKTIKKERIKSHLII